MRFINNDTSSIMVSATLPERILQFGYGSMYKKLSEFSDDFIAKDEVNNSSIVVVKSRNQTPILYNKDIPVSRILYDRKHWQEILDFAADPELRMIILDKKLSKKNILKDNINLTPPFSFPGKLLTLLFSRFKKFGNDPAKGIAIMSVNTDHVDPEVIQSILLEVAHLNELSPCFLDWLENSIRFYSIYK